MRMQILVKIKTQNIFFYSHWLLHIYGLPRNSCSHSNAIFMWFTCVIVHNHTIQQKTVLKTFLFLPNNHHSIVYWMKGYYNYDYDY